MQKTAFKYRIEPTKGMAACLGACCVKKNGKIVRYFTTDAEAHEWVQATIEMEAAQ